MVKSKSSQDLGDSITLKNDSFTKEAKKESSMLAHNLEDSNVLRTDDILTSDDVDFKSLFLPDFILRGLTAANFHRPSPIQLRSIPLLRLGLDLIVQSKAGTGKTLVITLAALETVKVESKRLQVIVVAPTREIALQTKHFISTVSSDVAVRTEVFIGGTSVKEDKKKLLGCQIAIGTPGRLNSLIGTGDMLLGHVRLFVLDEADKLMDSSIFAQVKSISKLLPPNKQTILCSATFLHPVKDYVVKHMKEPFWVTPEEATRFQAGNLEQQKAVSTVLLGVTQFAKEVPNHAQIVRKLRYKLEEILDILSGHSFTQCIIFSNYQTRAETICHQLVSNGWPAMSIRGQDEQSHRTETLNSFKELKSRVLLTTDVMSRGVDFKGVDLVINLDIPYDSSTYLHRMGRAGRFGSYGCVVTLASQGEEVENFKKILSDIKNTTVYDLPSDLSLIKEESKLENIFFGASDESENGFLKKELEAESCSENQRDMVLSTSEEMKCALKEEADIGEKIVAYEQINLQNEDDNFKNGLFDKACSELKESLPFVKADWEKATPSAVASSCESQRERVVKEASAHLSQVFCTPKEKPSTFLSFQELEKMCSKWMLNKGGDKSELPSSCGTANRKDWWTSANIVLTAANLQLQELKEKALSKTDDRKDVKQESSESSSESLPCVQSKERIQHFRKKRNYRKAVRDSNSHFLDIPSTQKKQGGDTQETTLCNENISWLWDESSKLYYVWDDQHSCYDLYNPFLKSYFKWEPNSNNYFKWDSKLRMYRLWNCDSNCYYGSNVQHSCSNNSNLTHSDSLRMQDEKYRSWFALWNKHIQQISWQVYQAEYLNNLLGNSHW